jgi:hypothetical protein
LASLNAQWFRKKGFTMIASKNNSRWFFDDRLIVVGHGELLFTIPYSISTIYEPMVIYLDNVTLAAYGKNWNNLPYDIILHLKLDNLKEEILEHFKSQKAESE